MSSKKVKYQVSPIEKINAVFQACRVLKLSVFDGNFVRHTQHHLWQRAADILENKVSPTTLGLNFAFNQDNVTEDFVKKYSVELLQIVGDSEQAQEHAKQQFELDANFKIVIAKQEWQLIRPFKKQTRTSFYLAMGLDYKKVLFTAIKLKVQIDCCLCVSSSQVRKGNKIGNELIKITGYCNLCHASLKITTDEEAFAADGSVTFNVSILGRKRQNQSVNKIKCITDSMKNVIGRRVQPSHDVILNAVAQACRELNQSIIDGTKVKDMFHPLWKRSAELLLNKESPLTLAFYFRVNRNNMRDYFIKLYGDEPFQIAENKRQAQGLVEVEECRPDKKLVENPGTDEECRSDKELVSNPGTNEECQPDAQLSDAHFCVVINEQQWQKIRPNKNNCSLSPDYKIVLLEAIRLESKIDCSLCIRKCEVKKGQPATKLLIIIQGCCSECSASLNVKAETDVLNAVGSITFYVSILGRNNKTHLELKQEQSFKAMNCITVPIKDTICRKVTASHVVRLNAVAQACGELNQSIFDGTDMKDIFHPIWKRAAEVSQNRESPKSLEFHFRINHNNLRDDFIRLYGVEPLQIVADSENSLNLAEVGECWPVGGILVEKTGIDEEYLPDKGLLVVSPGTHDEECRPEAQLLNAHFSVVINEHPWQKFQLYNIKRNSVSFWVMGLDYKKALFEAIRQESKIDCCLCIRNCEVKKGKPALRQFITIEGYCNECSASLKITAEKDFGADGLVTYNVSILGRNNYKHLKLKPKHQNVNSKIVPIYNKIGEQLPDSHLEKINAVALACRELNQSIFDGTHVKDELHPLWERAAELLDDKISPKTLGLYFKNNDKNVTKELMKVYGVEQMLIADLGKAKVEEWPLDEEHPVELKRSARFNIVIGQKEWQIIRPYKKLPKLRNGSCWVMGPGYKNVFLSALKLESNIDCCFDIAESSVNKEANATRELIKIEGNCCVCPATFTIIVNEEVFGADRSITFNVSILDREDFKHNNKKRTFKRPIRGRRLKTSHIERINSVALACRELNVSIFDGPILKHSHHPLWKRAAELLQNKLAPTTLRLDFGRNDKNLLEDFMKFYKVEQKKLIADEDRVQTLAVVEEQNRIIAESKQAQKMAEVKQVQTIENLEQAQKMAEVKQVQAIENLEEALNLDEEVTAENPESDEEWRPRAKVGAKPKIPVDAPKRNAYFNIVINKEQWQLIQPYNKVIAKGSSWVMGPDYTNVLFKAIRQESKIDCGLCVHNQTVKKGENVEEFIEINGYCNECSASLRITADKESIGADGSATLNVSILGRRDFTHKRKPRLTGGERTRIRNLLKRQTAFQVRNLLDKEVSNNPWEAIAPSLGTLRAVKSEAMREELGLKLELWESINHLKNDAAVGGRYFREIAFWRASVFYWSNEQVSIHNAIQKQTGTSVCISGTRGLVQPVRSDAWDMLLVLVTCHINDIVIPLGQLLAESKNSSVFSLWLDTWIGSGATIPFSVVIDRNDALENGVSKAFNFCTFSAYNEKCLELLKSEAPDANDDLNCWIRNDIPHLLKSIAAWNCWNMNKDDGRDSKHFYTMLIGYLTTISDLTTFVMVTQQIISVASAEFDTNEIQNARVTLIDYIDSDQFKETRRVVDIALMVDQPKRNRDRRKTGHEAVELDRSTKTSEDNNDEIIPKESMIKTKLTHLMDQFIDFLCQPARKSAKCPGNSRFRFSRNRFFSPEFVVQFRQLLRSFPTWTKLMQQQLGHSEHDESSVQSKNYRGKVAEELIPSGKIMRLDKFLVWHFKRIDTSIEKAYRSVGMEMPEKPKAHETPEEREPLVPEDYNPEIGEAVINIQSEPQTSVEDIFKTKQPNSRPSVRKRPHEEETTLDQEKIKVLVVPH